ncbi:MAG: response regulator transcription factor [Bacteroidetes Order II. Incertae sedis bacterium]|nr:response regulator transcription factor [Bacteroidetes Order II. bacterium]
MLKALIIDDEAPARTRMRKLLMPYIEAGRLELCEDASDGWEALEILETQLIDLVFLDIRMPELDGFSLLERIPPDNRPIVVFTTAYDEYALRAFQTNALHYLLKPVDQLQLADSIERAEKLRKMPEKKEIDQAKISKLLDWLEVQEMTKTSPPTRKAVTETYVSQISVPHRDRLIIVPVRQIVSIEVQDNLTRLFALPDQPSSFPKLVRHIVSHTLDDLEQRLNPDEFMRVHRAAIIRLDQIKEMIGWFSGRYKLILTSNHEVIASRERSKLLKKKMMF